MSAIVTGSAEASFSENGLVRHEGFAEVAVANDAPHETAVLLEDPRALDVVLPREADELILVAVPGDPRLAWNHEEQDVRDEANEERQDEGPDDPLENERRQDLRLTASGHRLQVQFPSANRYGQIVRADCRTTIG